MGRSLKPGLVVRGLLLVLTLGTLAACRVENYAAPMPLATTGYPAPQDIPTNKPPAPTALPSKVPEVAPTQQSATASSTGAEFTLTILHSGEVHGEVRPCG